MEIRSAADVAAVVRATRLDRQMSQMQLARAAGVSRRWLINLEAGKSGASLDLVLLVLSALNIPLTAGAEGTTPATAASRPAGNMAMTAAGQSSVRIDLDRHLRRFDGRHVEPR